MVAIVIGSVGILGALASTASASETPECFMAEAWDRPGIERSHELSRRAAGLLRSSGSVAFELSARMPAGKAGRGTVRLRRR